MFEYYGQKQKVKTMIQDYEEKKNTLIGPDNILDELIFCDLKDPWVLDTCIKYQKKKAKQYAAAYGDIEAEGAMYDLHDFYLLKNDLPNATAALNESAKMCERVAKHEGRGDSEYAKMMRVEYTGCAKYRREMAKQYEQMTEAELKAAKKEVLKHLDDERQCIRPGIFGILELLVEKTIRLLKGQG